jgi:hypothetical protein
MADKDYGRYREHGRIDKKSDAYNGISGESPQKQKAIAATRLKADKIAKRIKREGIG